MKVINYVLLILLGSMFVVRTGVEINRMVTETEVSFYPEIIRCGPKPVLSESLMVWNYRNLGVECGE